MQKWDPVIVILSVSQSHLETQGRVWGFELNLNLFPVFMRLDFFLLLRYAINNSVQILPRIKDGSIPAQSSYLLYPVLAHFCTVLVQMKE